MMNVILVIHIIACVLLTGFVLIQKSEGGGLGMGGGGGGGNALMSGRGAASAIMRMTLIVSGIFFITSLGLTAIVSRGMDASQSIYDEPGEEIVVPETPDLFDNSALIDTTITPAPVEETETVVPELDTEAPVVDTPETPAE